MDDEYAISVAKTEFREGFNTGDVDRVLSVFCDGFTDMSDGQPSFFGPDSAPALRQRLAGLFRDYRVEMAPAVIDIVVTGDTAYDYGWHKVWLTPKHGGEKILQKFRYLEMWRRQPDGKWKIKLWISNHELPPRMEPLPEDVRPMAATSPS